MGLTTWEDAPDGKIQRYDVSVAKNYLSQDELSSLGRIVSAYPDLAEDRARRHIPMKYRIIQDKLFQSDFDKLTEDLWDKK